MTDLPVEALKGLGFIVLLIVCIIVAINEDRITSAVKRGIKTIDSR